MQQPLWSPSPERIAHSHLRRFMEQASQAAGRNLSDYDSLWQWSVDEPEAFWPLVWRFAQLQATTPWTSVLEDPVMPGARWFPDMRLNFAQNLLRHRGGEPALVGVDETGASVTLSRDQLYDQVSRFQAFLVQQGVGVGDRVAGYLPNRVEAVVAMLATTALGATWSSASPDFGAQGVLDRFGQVRPKVLLFPDAYRYNGKVFDVLERATRIAAALPSVSTRVLVPVVDPQATLEGAVSWPQALDRPGGSVHFEALPFDHPVYIMFSSGTTGVPKAMIHGAGGTLIQHAKELLLHSDLHEGDAITWFTTLGWMMWNWLVSALLTGATVVLFDGSPGHPDLDVLWRMAARHGITHFGTSPKFLSTCAKAHVHPARDHDLSALRALMSTGAPLMPEHFRWVYERVGSDLQLASIAGGTDIISCFMLGSPIDPVYEGQIQKRGLGMRVESWDDQGHPHVGRKGELVCTAPFPSMPLGFLSDPDGARYRAAYFEHFPGVWRHGDWVELTPQGGIIIYGRSDATLNPGGVRIGTAEIYRQVEAMDEVLDAIVVGHRIDEGDTEVVLFVVLRPGLVLDAALEETIRTRIRKGASPRHVPGRIHQVPDIPRTRSGKRVEVAVTRIIHGESVPNLSALANPGALAAFEDLFASE